MRFLTGRPIELAHQFEQDDETNLTPAGVTVTITDTLGATVSTGAATGVAGTWEYAVSGFLGEGLYSVEWDGGATAVDVTNFEVVGAHLFSIAYARASDADLADAVEFPAGDIVDKREIVERDFERITGRSFTPRTVRITVEHDGLAEYLIPTQRDVRSVANVRDSAGDPVAGLAVDGDGHVTGWSSLAADTYSLDIAYGLTSVPSDVRRAGVVYLRALLAESNSAIPEHTTSYQPADGSTYTLGGASDVTDRTGIPSVDRVLAGHRERIIHSIYGGVQ